MSKALLLYRSTIGKKLIMAVTGAIMIGFLVVHMLANLQMFAGAEKINGYARGLRSLPPLLWGTRAVLLVAVLAHIVVAFQLTRLKQAARPIAYHTKANLESNAASRTMIWSGLFLLLFVLVHLANLTWGVLHPGFVHLDVFDNVIALFQVKAAALFYVVAMLVLGAHILHGGWSMFQSAGFGGTPFSPGLRKLMRGLAVATVVGFLAVVLAAASGLLHQG